MDSTHQAGFFQNKIEWLDKYADNLADVFGSTLVLSIGSILFAVICYFQKGEWQLPKDYFWYVITGSALTGLISLGLMYYFAYRAPEFEKREKSKPHPDVIYVISEYSIETLTALGVGDDIIKYLNKMRGVGELKMSIPLDPEENEFDWLEELKSKFGETRVGDFEETLLKYTRRKKVKSDKEIAKNA